MAAGDDYLERAEQHKPRTIEEIRVAAQQLLREGFTDYGVASALRMDVAAVRRLIGECVSCE